jgi:thiol-disulfide isomerase/thioredoxin
MIEVLTITPRTVSKVANAKKSNAPIVVLYHMEGCPHCVMMRPAWEACKERVAKAADKKVGVVAEVEFKGMSCLPADMQDVAGFPTIKGFKDGKATEYQGDRSQTSIMAFITDTLLSKPVSARPARVTKPRPVPTRRARSAPVGHKPVKPKA